MALIRVKRRVDEDPLEAFVLNSKRRKEEATADKDEVSTVLKFAGTVQNQRESLSQATKLTKDEARAIVSRGRREPQDDMRQKKRQEHRQNAQNERFRIVNCSRTIAETDGTESAPGDAAKEITILDIEKQSSDSRLEGETNSNSDKHITNEQRTSQAAAAGSSQVAVTPLVVEEEQGYVYDLYVPDVGQPELEWSEQFLENMLRVQPYDLMFDCYRDQKNMDFSDGDSDDSNEENYYRNDYPDSDESTGERAMRRAMDSMQIAGEMGGESSDEEDFYEGPSNGQKEEYVHTLDVDEPGFRGDVDFQDTADRYGVAYAKFKKKVLKAFADASEVPTDGEEDEDDDERSSTDRSWRGSDDEDCYSENEMDKFA